MKYLITGVGGFIGFNLSSKILSDPTNEVIGIDCLDNLLYSDIIKKQRIQKLQTKQNFAFYQKKLNDIFEIKLKCQIDYMINEAGLPGQLLSWDHVEKYFEYNSLGALKAYEFAIENRIGAFIQASTSSVYGYFAIGKETQVLKPASPYGISKLAAENLILANIEKEVKTNIVRYFSVYGPEQRPDMGIYKFINAGIHGNEILIYGDGEQKRDFTYVSDAVDATIEVLSKAKSGEIYNISGGNQISVNQLIGLIEKKLNKQIKKNYVKSPRGDQKETLADTEKIKDEIGWSPKVNFEVGLNKQIEWTKNYNLP